MPTAVEEARVPRRGNGEVTMWSRRGEGGEMAEHTEWRRKIEVSAAGRATGTEFLSSAPGGYDPDRQAGGEPPTRHSRAPHAFVVLARARSLRLRQANRCG
jgi:hypothetical protein